MKVEEPISKDTGEKNEIIDQLPEQVNFIL